MYLKWNDQSIEWPFRNFNLQPSLCFCHRFPRSLTARTTRGRPLLILKHLKRKKKNRSASGASAPTGQGKHLVSGATAGVPKNEARRKAAGWHFRRREPSAGSRENPHNSSKCDNNSKNKNSESTEESSPLQSRLTASECVASCCRYSLSARLKSLLVVIGEITYIDSPPPPPSRQVRLLLLLLMLLLLLSSSIKKILLVCEAQ